MPTRDSLYADPSTAPWYRKAWAVWRYWTARHTTRSAGPAITRFAWPTVGTGVITGRRNTTLSDLIARSRAGQ